MSGFHDHARGRLPAAAVGRRRRLTRLLGAGLLLTFVLVLVWGRVYLAADRQADNLHRGAMAVVTALRGDATAWEEVDDAYGDAARSAVLDSYPLFVLELTQHLRARRSVGDTPAAKAVVDALLAVDFEAARSRSAEIADPRGREWMEQLTGELLSAAAQK